MKPAYTAVFSLFLASACAAGLASADTAPAQLDRTDLAELAAAHDAAWNAHDPAALVELFVDDAVAVTPSGRRVEGRAALLELFAAPGPTKSTTSRSRIDSVRALGSDLALVTATQTLSGPGVEGLGSAQARLVAVTRRVDHQWRFVEAHVFAMPGSDRGAP